MRGTFTAGVLEAFAEEFMEGGRGFDFVIACSAGACNAASYLAGQPGRNRRVYLDFLDGGKMIRWSRWLTGGEIMDVDYLIDEVTVKLCPLDLDALRRCTTPLYIGVTDAETGEARFLSSHEDDLLSALRATCALPFFYRRQVHYQGRRYVDGGVSSPVPFGKAIELGAKELVVVLTSSIEDRARKRTWTHGLSHLMSLPAGVRRALDERHLRYQETAHLMATPPEGVQLFVVRPSRRLGVGRVSRDRRKLERACELGYEDGKEFLRVNSGVCRPTL